MSTTETITWRSAADELPDADETVLIEIDGGSDPVWLGFYDGERWYSVDGMPATVTHWAPMPAGPN